MEKVGLGGQYVCPALPTLASQAIGEVEGILKQRQGAPVCFVGSSLGGFYATYLAEQHGAKAVLMNPAVDPHVGLRPYLGLQKNLHTGEPYELTEAHLLEWKSLYTECLTPQRYLLLVETGDEVLDYRKAVARYTGAEQIVIEGGDHSLRSFAEHLSRIVRFAGLPR
jgi:predicted esterase YcpF (UPF0227 family)